jgi:hypothetical protein
VTGVWIVALAGYATTLAAALGAVRVGQRGEDRRWYATQVQLANVARADRLRDVYGQMAQAAIALRQVISERGFLFDGESAAEQDVRHRQQIRGAMGRVGEVGGQILVESSAEPVRDAYSIVASLVEHYMRIDTRRPETSSNQDAIMQTGNAVMEMTDQVIQRAREHLVDLETPILISSEKQQHGATVQPESIQNPSDHGT